MSKTFIKRVLNVFQALFKSAINQLHHRSEYFMLILTRTERNLKNDENLIPDFLNKQS